MPGIGPAPAETRRRRNEPARGEWVDLVPLDKPVLEELPDGEWSAETREMWEAWRADPVTAVWSSSAVAYAKATIRMIERGKTPPNEIRLRMDGLGLTPKGMRDLRYRASSDAGAVKPRARKSAASSSRQARLSVVQ